MPQPHPILVSAPGATSYHASALGRCAASSAAAAAVASAAGGAAVPRSAWDGTAFKWSLCDSLLRKYRAKAALLALGLHAGRRRAVRRLVREITAGPRLALMRACWAALVIATHTPPEQRALINARHAHATRRELRARLHVWRDAPPAPATHKAYAVAHWRRTRREAAVGTWRVVAAEWRVERHGCERADDHAAVQLLRRVIGAWGTHAAKKRRVRGAFSRPSQEPPPPPGGQPPPGGPPPRDPPSDDSPPTQPPRDPTPPPSAPAPSPYRQMYGRQAAGPSDPAVAVEVAEAVHHFLG